MSNGVNWPIVRLPDKRISVSSTTYTTAARSTNSHHGIDSSNRPDIGFDLAPQTDTARLSRLPT